MQQTQITIFTHKQSLTINHELSILNGDTRIKLKIHYVAETAFAVYISRIQYPLYTYCTTQQVNKKNILSELSVNITGNMHSGPLIGNFCILLTFNAQSGKNTSFMTQQHLCKCIYLIILYQLMNLFRNHHTSTYSES
jgi:hypothetical protein